MRVGPQYQAVVPEFDPGESLGAELGRGRAGGSPRCPRAVPPPLPRDHTPRGLTLGLSRGADPLPGAVVRGRSPMLSGGRFAGGTGSGRLPAGRWQLANRSPQPPPPLFFFLLPSPTRVFNQLMNAFVPISVRIFFIVIILFFSSLSMKPSDFPPRNISHSSYSAAALCKLI